MHWIGISRCFAIARFPFAFVMAVSDSHGEVIRENVRIAMDCSMARQCKGDLIGARPIGSAAG
jgi:hypothetical protein